MLVYLHQSMVKSMKVTCLRLACSFLETDYRSELISRRTIIIWEVRIDCGLEINTLESRCGLSAVTFCYVASPVVGGV
jgi:hypothetical protein